MRTSNRASGRGWAPGLAALLVVATALGASPSPQGPARAPDRDRLEALDRYFDDHGVQAMVASGLHVGVAESPFPEIRRRVDEVAAEPLDVVTGRVLARLWMEPEEDELDPESEEPKVAGALLAPATHPRWETWTRYVQGAEERPGGEDVRAVLTLRRRARVLKLRGWLETRTGRSWEDLTEEVVAPLREEDPYFRWLVDDVFEPVAVVFWESFEEGASGPSFSGVPVLQVAEAEGAHLGVEATEEGALLARRCDSVIQLRGDDYRMEDQIADDALAGTLVHELFHGIQYDLAGAGASTPGSRSENGHDAPVVSDRYLAFSEGWAELAEAWRGIDNAAYDNSEGSAPVPRWELGRQDPIRRNRYLNEDYEKFDTTDAARRRSRIKTGTQMIANEGLVAGVLYKLLTHRKLRDPMGLMLRTFYEAKPHTLTEMVEGMAARAPDPRQAAIVRLTFLHATRFATVSARARRLFQEADAAHLAWLQAKNEGTEGAELEALARSREDAQGRYRELTLALAKRVEAGELALDAAVGPELWFEGLDEDGDSFRFDLNTVQWWELRLAGISEAGREALLEARDGAERGFQGIEELATVLPEVDHARLVELRENFRNGSADRREAAGAE